MLCACNTPAQGQTVQMQVSNSFLPCRACALAFSTLTYRDADATDAATIRPATDTDATDAAAIRRPARDADATDAGKIRPTVERQLCPCSNRTAVAVVK